MKTTIDRAGRVVIPKEVRRAAGLQPGDNIEVMLKDGDVVIRQVEAQMRLQREGRFSVIVPESSTEPLDEAIVQQTIDQLREERTERGQGT